MRSTTLLPILAGLLLTNLVAIAEQPLKIGDQAPDWMALAGVDGKLYSLADFKDKQVLVIVFTCNSCPYANDYENRIMAFVDKHCGEESKTALIAINANKVKEDLPEEMKRRAEEQGYNFPYVWDETQQVARSHGATYTPEFFVFDAERKLAYRGAYDDSPDPRKAKKSYVADAVAALLAGDVPKVTETEAIGCAVRYERSRRPKSK